MNNISQATSWLLEGNDLILKNNIFVKSSFYHRFQKGQQAQNIATFIEKKLNHPMQPQEKKELLALADAFIIHCKSKRNQDKIARTFDRAIVCHKPDIQFSHESNQKSYQKWVNNHQPAYIYHQHPEFCTFLETSPLLSQMKITRDSVCEIEGEVALLVEGAWMKWSSLKDLFEIKFSKKYQESFIVHKETRDVYTYLDNGKGLQKHHPYLTESTPISTLNEEEYQRVLGKAHQFVRPEEAHLNSDERQALNGSRPFILQIVTSKIPGSDSRLHNLLLKAKHPYLRIITGIDDPKNNLHKGDVFDIGYGWKKKVTIPFIATQGQFRSPDIWEYANCEEKVVTNVALSLEETKTLQEYTLKYRRDGINLGVPLAFHLTRQNCTTYVHHALASVNIAVPAEISLGSLIYEISPAWIAVIIDFFVKLQKDTKKTLKNTVTLLPSPIHHASTSTVQKIYHFIRGAAKAVTACAIAPVFATLGGLFGKGGQAFVAPNALPNYVHPPLSDYRNWTRLSIYRVYLPGILQRWQRDQASTVVYRNPMQLAIVP